MSLETLLEAAEFLEKNQFSNNADNNQTELNSVAGHLKIDPSLPISFQFHTYSSSLPNTNNLLKHEELDNRINQPQGRTKSASFSISNSCLNYQQQNKSKRNRNLTSSDKTSINEVQIRHRELHKTLEKNRRAHLRSCFEQLKLELPKTEYAEKKYSHINIIHYAIHYINQLKKIDSDYKEELEKLNRIRTEYTNSLFNLRQQLINELNNSNQSSSNQSNDSSSDNLEISEGSSEDSDHDKRIYSIRTQKEIDDLLLHVEQSLLCATSSSENGSEVTNNQLIDLDNNSEPDDYDDETTTASECADDQECFDNVSTILNQCHA